MLSNDDNRPKRAPTLYNLYVKEKLKDFKDINITQTEKIKRIAIMWNEYKNKKKKKLFHYLHQLHYLHQIH